MNPKAKPKPVSVDDLQSLYNELRGSRSAPAIMDARAHFLERNWQDAFDSLNDAYQSYRESRQRILRQDPEKQVDAKAKDRDRQIKRLVRKQDKARELIEIFEDMLPQIQKLAEKESARREAKAKPQPTDDSASDVQQSTSGSPAARKEDFDKAWLKQFSSLIDDRQLEFVSSQFDFQPLLEPADVVTDAVYLLRKGGRGFLLHGQAMPDNPDKLHLVDLCNEKTQVDLSFAQLVKLSGKRKLVMLLSISVG